MQITEFALQHHTGWSLIIQNDKNYGFSSNKLCYLLQLVLPKLRIRIYFEQAFELEVSLI